MEVTLEEAYAEACRVIGEQTVTLRLLSRSTASQEAPSRSANHPMPEWSPEPEKEA